VKHPVLGWKVVQPYSDASNFIWIPTAGTFPGTYIVRVDLRIPTTTTPVASAEKSYFLWGPPPTRLTISPANGTLPVGAGSVNVAFSANASPAGKYEYRFRVQAPGSDYTTVRDFSTATSWTWTPPTNSAAVFNIAVDARPFGSTGNGDITGTTTFSVVAKSPASVTLSRSGSSQKASSAPKPVTFTANALPAGQYEYRFSVKDPATGWKVYDYTSSNTLNWTPPASAPGIYTIQVEVRPAGSTARPTVAVAGYSVL